MSIGSVSVDVVPDASHFVEKLKAKLSDIKDVKVGVNLDTDKARADLDKLATTRRSAEITAKANTTEAKAKLDELARTRTTKVRADVDKSSFSKAESAASGAASGMGALATAAITLGPALIPVTAAVVGLTGALAAGVAGAGGGTAIFAAAVIGQVKEMAKQQKNIKRISDLANKYAVGTKQHKMYQEELTSATKDFNKQFGPAAKGLDNLRGAWGKFLTATGRVTVGVIGKALNLVAKILPSLVPVANVFGKAISRALDNVSHWTDTKSFKGLVDFLAHQGLRSFKTFLDITGNVATGIGGLLGAFAPMGTSVLGSIDKATRKFATFGQTLTSNKGFQSFMAYVRRVGPQVGQTLRDLGSAMLNAVKALAPQGGVVLQLVDALAKMVAKAKPGQLAAIAGGIGAIGLATGKLGPLAGLSLIVSSLSYADKHSKVFHTLAEGAKDLARELGKLPTGGKVMGVLAAAAVVLKLRGGLGGSVGGRGGGVVSRVLGGGIQKVFVVNMAEGGVGGGPGLFGGSKGGKGKGGKLGRFGGMGFTKGNLAMFAALEIGSLVIGGGKGPGSKIAGGALQGAALGSYFGPVGAGVGAVAGGVTADALRRRYVSNAPDKSYASTMSQKDPKAKDLAKTYGLLYAQQQKIKAGNPDHFKTMLDIPGPIRENADKMRAIMEKLVKVTGMSPKAIRNAMLGIGKPAHSAALNFESLRFQAQKAHIGTQRLAKMLGSLPPTVVSKIITPGSLQSHKAIKDLAKQYGLTPKQVKTVIKLVGARDAQDNTKKTRDGLRTLNTTTAKPHIEIQGAREARAAARSVRASLAAIHDVHAKIAINAETDQYANKRRALRKATGGWINGPGTATSDSIPALLSNGEFVVNAASARRYHRELEAMNVQRFANGGPVGRSTSSGGRDGGQEIRGTLSIDRDGVAYIHGVSRGEVHQHAAAQQAAARSAALSL